VTTLKLGGLSSEPLRHFSEDPALSFLHGQKEAGEENLVQEGPQGIGKQTLKNTDDIQTGDFMFHLTPKPTFVAFALVLSLGSIAAAADFNDQDPVSFQAAIAQAPNCQQAVQMAKDHAWGSSMDIKTAGAAMTVCQKQLQAQNPSAETLELLTSMQSTCALRHAASFERGTTYESERAFCELSAIEWIINL